MGSGDVDLRASVMDASKLCLQTPETTPVWIEESKCKSLQGSRQNTPFTFSSSDPNTYLSRAIESALDTDSAIGNSWTALDGSNEPAYSPLGSQVPTPVDLGFIPMTAEPTPLMGLGHYGLQESSRIAQCLGLPDAAREGENIILPDPLGLPQWAPMRPGVGYIPRAESPSRQMHDTGGPQYSEILTGSYGEDTRVLSIGSHGHPVACGPACKYAWKARGCKEGLQCSRCHVCLWTRASMRLARGQH